MCKFTKKLSLTASTSALACAVLFITAPAAAQDQPGEEPAGRRTDVIVVSAERREQSLQKAPAAINVLSTEQLETLRVDNLESVMTLTPGLKLDGNARDQQRLGLRGAFSSTDTPGSGQSVGIYVDGVYMGRSADLGPVFFDMERVEVVRGPQGTLYGRNAVGGLINIITKDPTSEPEAELSATYGNYDRLEFGARVSGPLLDDLYGSISVVSTDTDGWARNLVTGNMLEQEDTKGVRTKLLWEPSENWSAKLSLSYFKDKTYGIPRFIVFGDPARFDVPEYDETFLARDGGYDRESLTGTVDVQWNLGWAELTSITSYHDLRSFVDDQNFVTDPVSNFSVDRTNDSQAFTQEVRLAGGSDRLNWQAGVYYYNDDAFRHEVFDAEFAADSNFPLSPPKVNTQALGVQSKSIAGFGQATYAATDWLNVTGGVRYTSDKKDAAYINTGDVFGPLGFLAEPAFALAQSDQWGELTYKGTLDASWDDVGPFDSLFFYGTVSKGYKEGGFFTGDTVASSTGSFDPEKAMNYEGGIKTVFADGAASLNVTYFHVDYRNLQSLTLTGAATQVASTDAKADGVEGDFVLHPFDGFSLSVGYAFLDTKIAADATHPNGSNVGGNVLPQSPKHSLNVGVSYFASLSPSTDMRFTGSYAYKGGVFFDVRNNRSSIPEVFNSSKQSNLDMELAFLRGNWEVALWGSNLLDDRTALRVFDFSRFTGLGPSDPGERLLDGPLDDPRMYGVTVRFKL